MVRDIPFASLCEHAPGPFIGRAHVAYIPATTAGDGLSKLARLVDGFARRCRSRAHDHPGGDAIDEVLSRGACSCHRGRAPGMSCAG